MVSITDVCVADCDYGLIKLSFQVSNQGGADVDAATVKLYAYGTTNVAIASVAVGAVLAGERIEGIEVDLLPGDLGVYGFLAVVDPDDAVTECDEDNNQDSYSDYSCE